VIAGVVVAVWGLGIVVWTCTVPVAVQENPQAQLLVDLAPVPVTLLLAVGIVGWPGVLLAAALGHLADRGRG